MKPSLTSQELYRELCDRLNSGLPWDDIALEFDCPAADLVDFVLTHREPPQRVKPGPQHITLNGVPITSHRAMARKFEQWRKSQGAMAS